MTLVPSVEKSLNNHLANETSNSALPLLFLQEITSKWELYSGHVTLALVRPMIGGASNKLMLDDQECADYIETRIEDLGIITKFSVVFSPELVDNFYNDSKAIMLKLPAYTPYFSSRWEEFSTLMQSGTTTCILLHSLESTAVELWRKQIGHWDIENQIEPNTIRGDLGVTNLNDLVHGSDSPENAFIELCLIGKHLEEISNNIA